MKPIIYFRKQYLSYAEDNTYDLCNKVLYDLCSNFPHHKNKSEVIAKILLIGRSYSASVERRKNKRNDTDDFYGDEVAPVLMKSRLDRFLSRLDGEKRISESNIGTILKAHKYLVDLLKRITKQDKRSLASKYLHFHYPHLFYLFDSRAVESLREIVIYRVEKDKYLNYDLPYASFFYKAYLLQHFVEDKYNVVLSPRKLDKILLEYHE
jgi:hypothetical protein